ncbi:MAG TPA: CpsD/CapB family tyrosine-protein kinase [Bryobacteraceae bacterium]|jgi:receptor protein-tyrosine kinase|nr:CpsD/CapB family tyrosine-protein kinase [Bryobacteraceae bacterium]
MSRVHDALRRAEQAGTFVPAGSPPPAAADRSTIKTTTATATIEPQQTPVKGLLEMVRVIPFEPSLDALIIDPRHPHNAPSEEFRTLRTRLNHMQSLQPIHTAVVTSPSPAEGKSFAAVNLALAEAQLAGNFTLLCDFDFRRPIIHHLFQADRGPGITDFLQGKCELHEAMRRVGDTNLFIMPAGGPVINPLELLNLKEVKEMLDRLTSLFNWIILDSPPLLFAADANLLSTLCHGTILVVRIGATTIDSIQRAMQSLCENNVLGIVVNGARRGELYSKYTYYHSYYPNGENGELEGAEPQEA